jgi:hypothetical protein
MKRVLIGEGIVEFNRHALPVAPCHFGGLELIQIPQYTY